MLVDGETVSRNTGDSETRQGGVHQSVFAAANMPTVRSTMLPETTSNGLALLEMRTKQKPSVVLEIKLARIHWTIFFL